MTNKPWGAPPPSPTYVSARAYLSAFSLFVIVAIAAVLGCCSISGCIVDQRPTAPPVRTVERVPAPAPVPDPLPNLSPAELEEMSGFDASTEQTRREQVRNNDLERRVYNLERRQRAITMRLFGVPELRIVDDAGESGQLGDAGDEPLPTPTEEPQQ